ncbi:hypothetical protein ACQ4LE_001166 [Meloidogyne hapla]
MSNYIVILTTLFFSHYFNLTFSGCGISVPNIENEQIVYTISIVIKPFEDHIDHAMVELSYKGKEYFRCYLLINFI